MRPPVRRQATSAPHRPLVLVEDLEDRMDDVADVAVDADRDDVLVVQPVVEGEGGVDEVVVAPEPVGPVAGVGLARIGRELRPRQRARQLLGDAGVDQVEAQVGVRRQLPLEVREQPAALLGRVVAVAVALGGLKLA